MQEQIKIAAKWWADQFRCGTKQDAGDAMINAFASIVKTDIKPEQIDLFESTLIEILPEHLKQFWKEDEPNFGSYLRSLFTDYGICKTLDIAAKKSEIPDMCPPFPMKTTMWINPDEVSVAHGYRGQIKTLWTKEEGIKNG